MCEVFFYTPKNELGATPFQKIGSEIFQKFPKDASQSSDYSILGRSQKTLCVLLGSQRNAQCSGKRRSIRMVYPLCVEFVVFPGGLTFLFGSLYAKIFPEIFWVIFKWGTICWCLGNTPFALWVFSLETPYNP